MGLKSRLVSAVRNSNKPALGAGLALAATYALATVLQLRAKDQMQGHVSTGPAAIETEPAGRRIGTKRGWPFWKAFALRIYERINEDRVLALAAGVVFYSLLAIFPAITALVSSYALFANPDTISGHMDNLAGVMPEAAFGVVREQVTRIVGHTRAGLSFAFIFGLLFAIWSANAGIKAVIDALNVAYGVKERRSFVMLNVTSLAFTIGALVAVLLALGAIVIVPVVFSYLPFDGSGAAVILKWLRWPVLAVLVILGLAVLYRFGPDHPHPRWHWITPGAVIAAVTWLVGSALLSWYLSNIADYNATYGSLGAGIGLMMWMWISAIVVLVGAEINSELGTAAPTAAALQARAGLAT